VLYVLYLFRVYYFVSVCVYFVVWFFWVFLCSFVLQYFDTVGWVFWPVKTVSHITYTVLAGTPPTQYRLCGRRFLQVKRPNQQYQSTEGQSYNTTQPTNHLTQSYWDPPHQGAALSDGDVRLFVCLSPFARAKTTRRVRQGVYNSWKSWKSPWICTVLREIFV